ncbi:hypothetical protein [Flammeovirga aprica]|uniref:DUF3857 domain-containing protein n=1 Tax=Flammeovirga aprica JL-4 TaxID=694437 RepID=A0A7X9S1Z2_9BACT|nr:hypothetical protein [Flammeovirga aprica]NME72903.1 hypothetical protein [Flammeovirga aprica JL-4]
MKKYITLFFVLIIHYAVQAQDNPIQEYIPSKDLTFLMYYNSAHVAQYQNIEKELSRDLQEINQFTDDMMVYTHSVDSFHVMLTVRFKLSEGVTSKKIYELIDESNFIISKEEGQFIDLEKEPNKPRTYCRYGFLHQGDEYWTLKLFYQQGFINKSYNALSEKVFREVTTDQISYSDYRSYVDSLDQEDLPFVKPYMTAVFNKEKQDVLQPNNIKKAVKVPQELNHLPVFTYINDQTHIPVSVVLGYDENLLSACLASSANEYFKTFEALNQVSEGEESWYGVDINKKEVNITNLATQASPSPKVKIDQEILQYFPSDATSWLTYGFDMEWLRDKIVNHLSPEPKRSEGEMKLRILTMGDDFLKVFQTGFIAFNKEKSSDLKFKAAFKMPNAEKGKLLIQTLSYEMDYLTKIDKETYLVTHPKFGNDETYLVIVDDIWILGAGRPELLKQKNKKVLQQHPELANSKTNMVMEVTDNTFGTESIIRRIYSNSEYLSKKKIRTKTTLELRLEN